jgi:FtsH-binding integral membrane protein
MTMTPATDTVVLADTASDQTSYVDWPSILAGIVLASAISLVLLTFGSAIGLSFTSFNAREGAAPIWVAIAAASWLLWVQVSSFMSGAYLTGRLRRRIGDATEHESDVRDGAHGLLVWAGALVVGAIIAVSGIGAAANAIGNAAGTAATAAATAADEGALDPNAYLIDTLFRAPAPEAQAAAPAAAPAASTGETVPEAGAVAAAPVTTPLAPAAALAVPVSDETRGEVSRVLLNAAADPVSEEDSTYLASLVARQTGMPQAEAEARVDTALARFEETKAQAVEAAETARRTGIIAAFLAAAALLVSAAGAWWAASMGGRHRDEQTVFADVFRRY